jgi:isopropylmalate/isohomocitrate dehydrogenase-like protein
MRYDRLKVERGRLKITRSYRLCVLPGDGIGPEVIEQTVRVLKALDINFEFNYGDIGLNAYQKHGRPLPDETVELFKNSDAALFGAVTTPTDIENYSSPVLQLRRNFRLFANVRPIISDKYNFVIIRENTEGLYSGRERLEDGGNTAVTERVITRAGSERIARFAFELAMDKGYDLVTVVHKANVMRQTCGLFRNVAFELAAEYPKISVEEMLVDRCAMELIKNPEQFQVIVTTNMFGDILSDEASMLIGGLGMACSGNIGTDHAMFEPVHGSAPELAGTGSANPIATIMAAKLMLEHLGLIDDGQRLKGAVRKVIVDGKVTPDLGGSLTAEGVANSIIEYLKN